MLPVQPDRIAARIDTLATIVDNDRPNYTRQSFTDTYLRGRGWLEREFRSVGLNTKLDAAGNLFGRREGSIPHLASIVVGSHTDTVVAGGRFDGIAGVVIALEAAQVLTEHNVRLQRPLEVVDFLAEEPSSYGVSCVGSRAWVGNLTPAHLAQVDAAGETLRDAIVRMGGRPDELDGPLRGDDDVAAFLELHIEQGLRLERAGDTIGIVSGVVGIRRYRVVLEGHANHAGTTPMDVRQDALVAAARVIAEVHERARHEPVEHALVATVGSIEVVPNSANVVPGEVRLILEVRAPQANVIDAFARSVLDRAEQTSRDAQCRFKAFEISDASPIMCDPDLQTALERAAHGRGHPVQVLFSGAGHDAAQVATRWPSGMIFVPSRNGISHHPDEWTSIEDIAAGAETILDAIQDLDLRLG